MSANAAPGNETKLPPGIRKTPLLKDGSFNYEARVHQRGVIHRNCVLQCCRRFVASPVVREFAKEGICTDRLRFRMTLKSFHRFVDTQNPVHGEVCAELTAGKKKTHWMWFVFPQLQGLGCSAMAVKFGVESAEEARAYWHHEVLGNRLRECVELVLQVKGKTAFQIFGTPDDLKFRSSLTLFARAVPEEPIFKEALAKYFNGLEDPKTKELLSAR